MTRALIAASLCCLLLLCTRAIWSGEVRWTGFFGNLLLAWIPFLLAQLLCWVLERPLPGRITIALLFIAWLLFFPNAAYIVTDLIHLKTRPPIPRWFDYILISSYAWTGLFLAYLSLALLHGQVRRWIGRRAGWIFVLASLAASSVGIYAGRFLRWNSWDAFARPWRITEGLVKVVELEVATEALAFSATFFVFSLGIYLMLHALAHLHAPVEEEEKSTDA